MPSGARQIVESFPLRESAIPARWVASVPRENSSGPAFGLTGGEEASPLVSNESRGCVLLFDGTLYNREELLAALGAEGAGLNDADVLLRSYERWGLDFASRIKGIFSIVVVDPGQDAVVAVRDPLGAFPLFMTETGRSVMFSTSIDALREQPGVDRSLNRAALADHLCRRWPTLHETFFTAIRRVPPGSVLQWRNGSTTSTRYWNPVPTDGPVPWVKEDEFEDRFDATFEQAARRALGHGRSGVFLSGGLDSISVTAMATDVARREHLPTPIALSLGFPGDSSEEFEQRAVARELGIDQDYVQFDEAVPSSQLLTLALEIGSARPAPLLNPWMPAYTQLTQRAKRRGVHAILSGAGGDEWLTVTPSLVADMIRTGDVRGLAQFIPAWKRSYNVPLPRILQILLWQFGARPLASAWLERVAPKAWKENRVARGVRGTLAWVAPDGPLRRELDDRVRRFMPPASPPNGFYFNDVTRSLEHPLTCMELEEIFEMGRANGVRFVHPYWDAEVADLLYRTPPLLLFSGGLSKSVVRKTMAKRFPALGLDRQKKRAGTAFFSLVLEREVADLWRQRPELSAMADLGIVEPGAATEMANTTIASNPGIGLVRIWDLINTESWIRAHQ
ncbi:MAG: asparagine synthetase B [Vicinamibacterales bacterium]